MRALIEKIVLTPKPTAPDGLAAELYGDLAEILALASSPAATGGGGVGDSDAASTRSAASALTTTNSPERGALGSLGSQLSVVAGARSHLKLLFQAAA